jgi:hypothetical protein
MMARRVLHQRDKPLMHGGARIDATWRPRVLVPISHRDDDAVVVTTISVPRVCMVLGSLS